MSATLQLKSDANDTVFPCGELVTIGRGRQNTVRLEGVKASRNHALVRCLAESKYYLVDMGSTNGTLVNDKRVLVPCALTNGDVIKIGDYVLIFNQELIPGGMDSHMSVMSQATLPSLGGQIQKITILVTDIRDYTSLSELTPANLLAQLLGRWFRGSNDIVEEYGGMIDKFIGDAVMARWVEDRKGSTVVAALKAVHKMNLLACSLVEEFQDFHHPFRIGAGINTGEAVLGNVGANSRRDYTALGDAVNLAFRFESATKAIKKDIILGPNCCEYLPEKVTQMEQQTITVKGKEKPISVLAMTFQDLSGLISGKVL